MSTQIVPVQQPFVTSLGKTLSQILPSDATLYQFDMLRSKAKEKQGYSSTNKHLKVVSQQMKRTLISKYRELTKIVSRREIEEKQLGHTLKAKTHLKSVVHKLNLIKKVLAHEWKIDIDRLR